jgi:hypothetical protein
MMTFGYVSYGLLNARREVYEENLSLEREEGFDLQGDKNLDGSINPTSSRILMCLLAVD